MLEQEKRLQGEGRDKYFLLGAHWFTYTFIFFPNREVLIILKIDILEYILFPVQFLPKAATEHNYY